MDTLPALGESPTRPPSGPRQGASATATMGTSPVLERPVRVRIHITKGQRVALRMVAEGAPDAERLAVRDFTASFDMTDPIGWLEARMAQWPRGEFPRASLHAVLRKLSSSIQGQVEPDLEAPKSGEVGS